jgi:hypothetical protein
MNYETAYSLISSNVHVEKMITDTGEKISWIEMQAYKLNNDYSNIKQLDVYIKISKQYCPKAVLKNKSRTITKFDHADCTEDYQCKALGYVWHGGRNDCYAMMGSYECFPNNSKIVANTLNYVKLKCTFDNIRKKDLYNQYKDMLQHLTKSCTYCLKKKWENTSTEKFKALNNFKQENQGR